MVFNTFIIAQWKKIDIPNELKSKEPFLEIMFLKDNPKLGWICGFDGRVLRTTDGGNNWAGIKIPTATQLESINFLDSFNGYTSGAGRIFKSTDGGVSWRNITDPRVDVYLWGSYFVNPDIGMVVGGGCNAEHQQFFRTTNGGYSWSYTQYTEFNTGLSEIYLSSETGTGYAVSSGKIWKTFDGGLTWNVFASTGTPDWHEDLAISGNTILLPYSSGCSGAENNGGARISTDGGISWNQFNTGSPMFGTFLQNENCGWVVGWDNKIYYTSDRGLNWELRNRGIIQGDNIDDIWVINDTLGFVVGINIYITNNIDSLTSVPHENIIPNKPTIVPNPFSDNAEIFFTLPNDDYVELTLFSLTGEKLKVLTSEFYSQGKHCIKLDNNYLSGMFFVVMKSSFGIQTEKMLVIN